MRASFASVSFFILLALSHTSECHDEQRRARSLQTGPRAEAASRRAAAETADPDTVASKLQAVLFRTSVDWSNADDTADGAADEDLPDSPHYEANEQEIAKQLQQVLGVAETLLQTSRGCKAGARGGGGGSGGKNAEQSRQSPSVDCPAAAPELLQGGTAAFLASTLHTHPRGPTSREKLIAWAAAANAFLQEHSALQRQQRHAAERAGQLAVAASAEAGAEARARRRRRLAADPRVNSTTTTTAAALNVTHRVAPAAAAFITANGLPLVRRVLLAQLLLGWVSDLRRELPASAEVTEPLAALLTKLYDIHVDSVVDRAALEYFHISKAGGTSWTAAARANGCSIPRAKAARTPEFDDDCRWFDPRVLTLLGLSQQEAARTLVCPRYGIVGRRSTLRDCARRLEHFRRVGLHYTSNEYTLHGGRDSMYGTHICPHFVTVATIREPLGRLLSNIRYIMVQLKRDKALRPEVFAEAFCNRTAADWEVYAPPVADNYNIRTLVGERAFHAPLYGIGEAHEAIAKQLLLQFDLVLDLNAGDPAADLLMRAGLGWNTTLAEIHVWDSAKLAKRGALDFATCPTGDIEPLMSRQMYDQRWYSFGRTLSRLDQLFLSAAAQLGRRPWPGDWAERSLEPPPEEGFVREECGLVGLIPPPPVPPRTPLPHPSPAPAPHPGSPGSTGPAANGAAAAAVAGAGDPGPGGAGGERQMQQQRRRRRRRRRWTRRRG